MIDLKPTLLKALAKVPACTRSSFAREEIPLPVVVLSDEEGRVLSQADGRPFLEEYVQAVDIYAADPASLSALTLQTDAALTALGLRRLTQSDLYDETAYAWRKHLRYRAVVQGDTIYQ